MTDETIRGTGECLCGNVRYQVRGPLREILECHCRTCRRFSGGLWHATAALREHVTVLEGGTLKWYQSSAKVKRGFCGACGSSLFWSREGLPYLGITAGTLNEPTGLKLVARIFTTETADYYDLHAEHPPLPELEQELKIPVR